MLHRVNAYIKEEGLDQELPCSSSSTVATEKHSFVQDIPKEGWKDIKSSINGTFKLNFNNSNIVSYFISRSVTDGLPAGDFKAINKSAEYLFRCGHIQSIEYIVSKNNIYIKSQCLPEMRKDRVYNVCIGLEADCSDIIYAACGCPAGKGPRGSCKHIAALTYGLSEFCKVFEHSLSQTCTDVLQKWNQPRAKRVNPIPVDELGCRRRELTKPSRKTNAVYDPRPLSLRQESSAALEKLRCDLINLPQKCALTNILIPAVDKIKSDHCYTTLTVEDKPPETSMNDSHTATSFTPCPYTEEEKRKKGEEIIEKLTLTEAQREELERKTRYQSKDPLWFEVRRNRITGSKCGRILIQKKQSVSLLQFSLYPKPLIYLPKAIYWGKTHESKACGEYTKYMNANGHTGLSTRRSGFVVHSDKRSLGASPDAWVHDSSCEFPDGIAEFKCPYSKADVSPSEACEDPSFYCDFTDGKLRLKCSHSYYHQVQLQLYVCGSKAAFCDFCIYTLKGVLIERIFPDKQWQENEAVQLDCYFIDHMLQELIYPTNKPAYYL